MDTVSHISANTVYITVYITIYILQSDTNTDNKNPKKCF